MPRVMEIATPLGADVLLFRSMSATEEMGRLFEYQIEVLSKKNDVNPDEILGKNVTVKLELAEGGGPRCFDGYVTRFGLVGVTGRYFRYRFTARPWLWLLTRTSDCRIFQKKKVPDIVKEIFDKYPAAAFENRLTGSYSEWDYCVQYRETDFNFVSRLMEHEGIYYFFEHKDGKHTLVLADSPSAHSPFEGYGSVPFIPHDRGGRLDQEYVGDWLFDREIQTGAYMLEDYDFTKPSTDLRVSTKHKREHAEAAGEFYDYPGEYNVNADGEHYVRTRLEELQCCHERAMGAGNARGIAAGCLFKLTGQTREDQNREYLVVSASTEFEFDEYESQMSSGPRFRCNFTALPSREPFRSQRLTPKPIVQGPQTAVVVGPKGDEIYTDEYGRVKVQFHWDRLGKQDENSSCWVRVSQPWAGKNWGFMQIPRIGQEVVVDFLEGDPDQPIITGRVYNAEQMPPWGLPDNKTQSGVLTRSTTGGAAANANAIRFEDKKGAEQLWIHAEKNQDIEVENDETHWVGHDRTKTIDNDETEHVKHDRKKTIDNNETVTVGVDRTESVGNNESITIGVNRTESVGANEDITIGANRTESVGANETINIASNRSITVGASETATVALQRTHSVGVNETIAIGAAQEVAIGAAQTIAVGAAQSITVGANQSTSVGAKQSLDVGADRSVSVGGGQTTKVGKARSADVGQDDSLKVGKNLVIDAGDSVTIKTGSASITMKKDGTITIKGKDITIDGSGKINVKASSNVVIKGSKVLQN
ncbi:type VI secretion system Vgr family protein [Methylibium rhizosphaerae]|uniref:type VI secretion system Vgr family protein n=1 Tax=Methylibium rhizosphaerae TaxID=2570323 RepID=UPI001129A518|nr:type VI secretion system tip protein TssI/VgrG [Methylibium rhizosphaerae]